MLAAGLLPLLALATACSGEPVSTEGTPQALAAAVTEHYDAELRAVAPLSAADGYPEIEDDELAVEMAFAAPGGGDNTHVRVVVSPTDPYVDDEYGFPDCETFECEDLTGDLPDGGVDALLLWEQGHPEEDPGAVVALADYGDHFVRAHAYGPLVTEDHAEDPEVSALSEALASVVTDPGVGYLVSEAYAEEGAEICAGDAWLDWYGQGNGTPRPDDLVEWC